MELFFNAASSNPLRDRTTGTLSDLLSETIERMRAKTGGEVLGVAGALRVNHNNTLLTSVPLKEEVSRKRKRACAPTQFNGLCKPDTNGHHTENGGESDKNTVLNNGTKPGSEKTILKSKSKHSGIVENGVTPSESIPRKPTHPSDNKKKAVKLPPQQPPQQPPPDSKKKKRKSFKELHRDCYRQFIKLEDTILAEVPLLEDEGGLASLLDSPCPENWQVGKPRTPLFRRRTFCRRCILGEK